MPCNLQINAGEMDWQSVPVNVKYFREQTIIPVSVVPSDGQMLELRYVGNLLNPWLSQ